MIRCLLALLCLCFTVSSLAERRYPITIVQIDSDFTRARIAELSRSSADFLTGYREDALKRRCPAIAAYYYGLFDHLVQSNDLLEFQRTLPGLRLKVECLTVKPNGSTSSDGQNTIRFPSYLLGSLKSDDQIAFVLAHEMAHVLLGHPARLADVEPAVLSQKRIEFEHEADRLAVLLGANAGYDTKAMKKALIRVHKYRKKRNLLQHVLWSPKQVNDPAHGRLQDRLEVVKSTRDALQIPRQKKQRSPGLKAARAELKRLGSLSKF